MRKLLGAVLTLVVAGCATGSQVSQVQSSGNYDLIAVDGQAIPHVLAGGPEVLSGTLFLHGDGTFEVKTVMRARVSAPEALSFVRERVGVYTVSPIGVQLAWRTGGESVGAFLGKTLRIYIDGVEYLYLKQ